jgi:UDP-glucose 4-epimerase
LNKVLIAGGAGFIGEQLASALVSHGSIVHLVDNLSRGHDDEALKALLGTGCARLNQVNLVDPAALDEFGDDYAFIVNLAAIVGVENVSQHPYETLRDNVLLQDSIIRLAKRQKALQRFLFASSSEVYAGSLIHLAMPVPTPEDFPLAITPLTEPRTSYMLSKIYGEAMLRHSALPFTIVRPHNIYGPRMGMSHVIPQLLAKAHRAAPRSAIDVYSADHTRSFCYIDDAIEMLLGVLQSSSARDEVLNLGSESPEVTIEELAEVIIATVGKPLSIVRKPATPGSPARRAPEMSRMKQVTGRVAKVPLAEGVRRTYEWYRRKWSPEQQIPTGLNKCRP